MPNVFLVYDKCLCFAIFQWQNRYGMKSAKKQAGYGMQSHACPAMMDVAQPLSSDAKVHLSCSSLKYYLTLLTA
jgi:hypothetical protein